jgi:hypothetical protein
MTLRLTRASTETLVPFMYLNQLIALMKLQIMFSKSQAHSAIPLSQICRTGLRAEALLVGVNG